MAKKPQSAMEELEQIEEELEEEIAKQAPQGGELRIGEDTIEVTPEMIQTGVAPASEADRKAELDQAAENAAREQVSQYEQAMSASVREATLMCENTIAQVMQAAKRYPSQFEALLQSIRQLREDMREHPLLDCRVDGTGHLCDGAGNQINRDYSPVTPTEE